MSLARFFSSTPVYTGSDLVNPRGIFSIFDDPFFSSPFPSSFSQNLGKELENTVFTRTPNFDIRESEHEFLLQGELPGVDKNNLELEFVDPQTLSVRGKIERSQEYKPDAAAAESTAVTKAGNKEEALTTTNKDNHKYWASERVYGEFSRRFKFPSKVDAEKVSASLKNGILNVKVPKVGETKPETKKITIVDE